MSFLSKVFKAAKSVVQPVLGAATNTVGGGLALGLGGSLLGGVLDRRRDRQNVRDRYGFYAGRGATTQEILGSPVPGGNPTTSMGQTLGNAGGQLALRSADYDFQAGQRALDRATSLEQTRIAGENQARAAAITSEPGRIMAQNASAKLPTELATLKHGEFMARPETQMFLKNLQMGPANSYNMALQRKYGVDPTDAKSWNNATQAQREGFLSDALAATSTIGANFEGVRSSLGKALNQGKAAVDSLLGNGNSGDPSSTPLRLEITPNE